MATRAKSGAKKAPKGPRKAPRTKATAPGADGPKPLDHNEKGSRLTPDQERALFTSHRQLWNAHQAKQKALDEQRTKLVANLKNDGFKVLHMDIADALANPKGEKKQHDAVMDRLKVARWVGHPMGAQMDLFNQPDRTPAVDRAYDEGKQTSMEGRPKKPPYSPELPQYQRWMNGYDDDQERLRATVGRGTSAAAASGGGVSSKDGDPVQGGTPKPRSEFQRELAQTVAEGDPMTKRETPPAPAEPPPEDTTKH